MRTKRLSANQLDVQQCDYGARVRTLYSLRKLGLTDVMDAATDKGRQVLADEGKLT